MLPTNDQLPIPDDGETQAVENQEPQFTDEERISLMVDEFVSWHSKLTPYQQDMRIDEQLYQGFDPQNPARIPTMTVPSMIESFVARAADTSWSVNTKVRGAIGQINRKIEQTIHNVAEGLKDDPDIAQFYGSYADEKEKLIRDLFVVGNCIGTIEYCYYATETRDGKRKVLADGPYLCYEPWDRYVFNPAYTFTKSPVKYIQRFTSMSALEVDEEVETEMVEPVEANPEYSEMLEGTGYKKVTTTKGKWKNLDKLREMHSAEGFVDVTPYNGMGDANGVSGSQFFSMGGQEISQYREEVELLYRTDGAYLTVIADRSVIIFEEYDPYGIGGDNVVTAMNYKYKNRPYAYGEMAFARGVLRLQDQSFNQRAAVIERALKVGVLINDTEANEKVIADVIRNGGVAKGNASSVQVLNAVNIPQQAFMMSTEYNQVLERTLRWSAYASGLPNQTSDTTGGTKGGIDAIQQAAEPNFKIKLRIIGESIDTPWLRKAIKMKATLTADNDLMWALKAGSSRDYVQIAKRFLQGNPTVDDLIAAGVLDQETAMQYTHRQVQLPDGTASVQPIPGMDSEPYVDADWCITVTLDPRTAADRYKKAQSKMQMLEFAESKGQPVDWAKAIPDIAAEMGDEDFEEYFLSPEVVQQQQDAQQQQQQQVMDAQGQQAQDAHSRQMELLQMKQQHELGLKQLDMQAAPQAQLSYGQ